MEFKVIYQALCQNHSHTSSLATIYLLTKQNNTQSETNKPDKHRTSASALDTFPVRTGWLAYPCDDRTDRCFSAGLTEGREGGGEGRERGMEGRLHLSNISDEDPSLRRTDRGRTLSNHARHGPRSREPVSKAFPHSAQSYSLWPALSLSLSLTHTHTRTHCSF